jgi:molybdenum cofactor synthesis domain-containing protein
VTGVDSAAVMTTGSAVVITCSTRAALGVYPDRSGPVIVDALRRWGLQVGEVVVVADGPDVEAVLRAAVSTGAVLVVTTGGTGLSPTDGTPEATLRVVDRLVPGIAEAIRSAGFRAGVPFAMLSRGVSGLAGRTLVVNLPGSTGGVRDGIAVLEPVVAHALSQIQGGDH